MGKLICVWRDKQSLSSYRIAPNGNRKRSGSIQQHFCFHCTAKCDGSLRNGPKKRSNIMETVYNYKNIIRYKTCYKNPENPKCIYLMMTNISKSFQNSLAIETGLSDIHKMCLTVLKFSTPNKNRILFIIKVTRNFQMWLWSMISKTFFQFSSGLESCFFEEFKETFAFKKKNMLEWTRLPLLIN